MPVCICKKEAEENQDFKFFVRGYVICSMDCLEEMIAKEVPEEMKIKNLLSHPEKIIRLQAEAILYDLKKYHPNGN